MSISQQAASPRSVEPAASPSPPPGQDGTSCKIRILPSSQPALRQLEMEARGRPNPCFLLEKDQEGRRERRTDDKLGLTRTKFLGLSAESERNGSGSTVKKINRIRVTAFFHFGMWDDNRGSRFQSLGTGP